MDDLQRQAGLEVLVGLAGPATKQIPCAQAQVFGGQEPNAHHCPGDLVGQQLPNAALEGGRIRRFAAQFAFRALGLDHQRRIIRAKGVEFFFEGQTGRSLVRRCFG